MLRKQAKFYFNNFFNGDKLSTDNTNDFPKRKLFGNIYGNSLWLMH